MVFLPSLAYVLLLLGSAFFLLNNWDQVKRAGWGDKKVVIPLLFIALMIGLSGLINADTWSGRIAPLGLALFLLTIYASSRVLGPSLFRMMVPFILLGVGIILVLEVVAPGNLTGGLITNSTAMAGFLVFGALTNQGKWQWLLCLAALLGILVNGGLTGFFIVGVLGLMVLARRDFGRNLWIVAGAAAAAIIAGLTISSLTPLHEGTRNTSTLIGLITGQLPWDATTLDALLTGRWTINTNAIHNLQPWIGHGLTLTVESTTAHNVPLVIVQQVGIPAALAWTFVTLYCLVKTRWTYLWVAALATCAFDHFLWTQFTAYWWVFVGISLSSDIKSDLIFRRKIDQPVNTTEPALQAD